MVPGEISVGSAEIGKSQTNDGIYMLPQWQTNMKQCTGNRTTLSSSSGMPSYSGDQEVKVGGVM